jgi:hypothetical protein
MSQVQAGTILTTCSQDRAHLHKKLGKVKEEIRSVQIKEECQDLAITTRGIIDGMKFMFRLVVSRDLMLSQGIKDSTQDREPIHPQLSLEMMASR